MGNTQRSARALEHAARLLVVEDDADLRRLLAMVLIDEGYQVREACNGADALAKLADAPADLILADGRMPVMNGRELAEHLGENGQTEPPLILMSADDDGQPSPRITEYVAKPFELDELLSSVQRLTRSHD